MNDRDTRLLERLVVSLVTMMEDNEIIAAVRAIQTIANRNKLDPTVMKLHTGDELTETVVLDDRRQHVAVRMRSLGFMLSAGRNRNPDMDAAMVRFSTALKGSDGISVEDLRAGLASIRDLMQQLAHAARQGDIFDQPWRR